MAEPDTVAAMDQGRARARDYTDRLFETIVRNQDPGELINRIADEILALTEDELYALAMGAISELGVAKIQLASLQGQLEGETGTPTSGGQPGP